MTVGEDDNPTQPLPVVDIPQPRWPAVDVDHDPRLTLLVRVIEGLRRL